MMTCEACVSLVVEIATGLFHTIFYGADDRLTRKTCLCVESCEYVEVYYGMLSFLVCNFVDFESKLLYNISCAV